VIYKPAEELLETDLETYHCPDIRRIDITKIDPSLLLGFYCQNFSQVKDFLNRAQVFFFSFFFLHKYPK